MSCFTNESLITSVGAVGDVCSGRGQCINNACVCDTYWTGRADLISLEGFACQNPVIFDKLMYSFTAFMHFKLFIQVLPSVLFQAKQYRKRRQNNARNACGTFPAVAFMEFFAIPALGAIFVARAATELNFGVDLALSVVFAIVFSLYLFAVSYMESTLFRHMMIGGAEVGTHQKMVKLVNFDTRMNFIGTCFYSAIISISLIVPVFLPLGPTMERVGLMILRNLGTMFYFGFYSIHHKMLRKRLLGMMDPSKSNDRLNRALAKIDASIGMATKRTILMIFIYTVFMVCPPIYSFQYVAWSFILGIACGGNHILTQLSNGKQHEDDKSPSSDPNKVMTADTDRIVPMNSKDDVSPATSPSSNNQA